MSRPANLDVIEFIHAITRQLRVYYQSDGEQTVRESCYRGDYGWFVRGEGVVTRQAKLSSRITATRWLGDGNNMKVISFSYHKSRLVMLETNHSRYVSFISMTQIKSVG
jgi:hypothetical protein